jgi:hypothetical protein
MIMIGGLKVEIEDVSREDLQALMQLPAEPQISHHFW